MDLLTIAARRGFAPPRRFCGATFQGCREGFYDNLVA